MTSALAASQESRIRSWFLSGGYREGVTPVPIPNTEVKAFFGDDTWVIKPWESSALPVYEKRHRKMSFFYYPSKVRPLMQCIL